MDEDKKKQINDAIAILREECSKHRNCRYCPLWVRCCGPSIYPSDWKDIE